MAHSDKAAALAWLTTEAGTVLLAEADALPPDRLTRLTRLRRHVSAEVAAAAVELLELRRRAAAKFAQADRMFFTAEGLEQSTGETIARYRAARFPVGISVLDVCCGIGGDALALTERGRVVAVDSHQEAIRCAAANARLLPEARREVLFPLCADATTLPLTRLRTNGIEAAFFDPSRRGEARDGGRRRVRDASEYSPPLDWLETLRAHFSMLAVKVSPAVEDALLRRYEARAEFISDRGECKEAVLWFGEFAESFSPPLPSQEENYSATVLRPSHPPATLSLFPCHAPPLSAPRDWLYEPDPAVIRAHLISQVSSLLSAAQLSSQIAYLTADALTPTPFATAYRVLDWLPYNLKDIQKRLRALGRGVAAVKKRGVPFVPEEVIQRLTGGKVETEGAIVVLTRHGEKPIALLCERAGDESKGMRHEA